jgi:hypothetical protein
MRVCQPPAKRTGPLIAANGMRPALGLRDDLANRLVFYLPLEQAKRAY